MGFAGLAALVSELSDGEPRQRTPEDQRENRDVAGRIDRPAASPARTETPRSGSTTPTTGSRTGDTKGRGGMGLVAVVLGISAVGLVGLMLHLKVNEKTPARAEPPSSSQAPVASPAPPATPEVKREAKRPELTFVQPPIGREHVLSVAQIRWCVREDMRLNHYRPLALTQTQIAEFNTTIADYNSRCSSYRYRQGTLARARREVEGERTQLLAGFSPPWRESEDGSEGDEETRDLQRMLKEMGYDPGPIDGKMGERTRSAIDAFLRDTGGQSDQ